MENKKKSIVFSLLIFLHSDEIFESAEDDDLVPTLDPDHRLMLQNTLCLMQSRNSAVVLATAVLHFYMAPPAEVGRIAKPMVRLLHADRETEYVALANIATMAATYPRLFSDVVDEFFVAGCESLPTRTLKLDILTRSANEQNIGRILKELKEYSRDENKEFVAAAVQAIGRCATALPDVADSCMQQLVQLMVTSASQTVVAESIVVIKRLLQMNASREGCGSGEGGASAAEDAREQGRAEQRDVRIIKQLARMLGENSVTVPQARAAIIWLVGEYSGKIPERAPDVLRCLAKTFLDESDLVKLQILTLGAKLVLAAEPGAPAPRVVAILRYVLQLAKYDQNYDIRDRARLLRRLLLADADPARGDDVRRAARALFMTEKPVPAFESVADLSAGYVLGTLSHIIHDVAPGYRPLDDFPEVAPDPAARSPPAAQAHAPEREAPPQLGAFTGLVPGQDPDQYLFGQGDGLGDDADDDGWGAGWDDDDDTGDKKAPKKGADEEDDDDDWGMGDDGGDDDGFGAGADEAKEGDDEGDLWDLGDAGAEKKDGEDEAGDDWGVDDAEKPQKEEAKEEEPEPAQTEKSSEGDAADAPADAAPAVAEEEPAKEPSEEAAPSTGVADVEEGEADE